MWGLNLEFKADRPIDREKKRLTRRGILRRFFVGGAFLAAPTGVYAHELEPEEIQVARVDVRIKGLSRDAEGITIGRISDTHCDSPRAAARAAKAAQILKKLKPDIVALTGDYITHNPHTRMNAAAKALEPLSDAPLGAFAVMGNHDWWSGDPDYVAKQLHGAGFRVLRNASIPINGHDRLWLVGLEQRCDDLQDPDIALYGVPNDTVKVLLIHEPDYADEAPKGFSLQLSGHSHGGQVRIPGLPPIHTPTFGRRYPEGLRQAQNHLVYTTRGVGMVGPKFRLFCPPEVGLLRLIPA